MGINDSYKPLQEVVDEQLGIIKANHRTYPNDVMVLVNFMPILGIMQPYQLITEEQKDEYVKQGYPKPVSMLNNKTLKEVPYIKRTPAYAYYVFPSTDKPIFNYTKKESTPRCVFKQGPNSAVYPALIKVKDNFYYNPNIKLLKTVLRDYHSVSDMTIYCGDQANAWLTMHYSAPYSGEISYYNYVTQTFSELMKARSTSDDKYAEHPTVKKFTANGISVEQVRRLFETHMFRAQSELGHYFSTFRKKFTINRDLSYCYNDEFVPIYYGMGIGSFLNDTVTMCAFTDAFTGMPYTISPLRFVDALVLIIKSKSFFDTSNYSSTIMDIIHKIDWEKVPECAELIVSDYTVMRDLKSKINHKNNGQVYFMTRKDIHILTQTLYEPNSNDTAVQRDTYQYRAVMPYLYYSLLRILDTMITSGDLQFITATRRVTSDDIIKPDNWTYTVYETETSVASAEDLENIGESIDPSLLDYVIVPSYNNESQLINRNDHNKINVFTYNNFIDLFYNLRVNGASSRFLFEDKRYSSDNENVFINSSNLTGINTPTIDSNSIIATYLSFMLLLNKFFSKGAV